MKKYKVLFTPSFKEVMAGEGSSVLEAARQAGVYIHSDCNGKGQCGKCRIHLKEGDAGLFNGRESKFIKGLDRRQGYRLACKTRILGEMTVQVPEEHILLTKEAKKVFSKRSKRIDPAVKSYYLNLSEGKKTRGDYFEKITQSLAVSYGLKDLQFAPAVRNSLKRKSKKNRQKITILVWMDKKIISVRTGRDETCLGLAVDIGTTTIALYLCNLQNGEIIAVGSITNPQVLYGADIMSRIAYCVDHPGVGLKKLQKELVDSLNTLIDRMTNENGFSPNQIMDVTVVGNTVMHHIFLGLAPDRLGLWPFTPALKGGVDKKAAALGIHIHPSAYVHVLPVEAGFVGADNVGVLLSEEPYNRHELSLIIDLGTNGEIVLGNREILLSCSCATGPAFEGAHISNGMRATPGAIEKIRFDPNGFKVDYKVVGRKGWASKHSPGYLQPAGICGSGIIDSLAQLFNLGLIKENGAFSKEWNHPRLRRGTSGVMEFVLVWKQETATGKDIALSQKDIRQVQLAKAAVLAGCRILLNHLGASSVNRMRIAGAFGQHINKEHALTIGLFPWCDPKNIRLVGNAAGHGAYLTLLDKEKRKEAETVAGRVVHIELALENEFQSQFMKALSLSYQSKGV